MLLRLAIVLVTTVTMSACANQAGSRMGLFSATAPVIAILADDLFVGETEGYADRSGKITVQSQVQPDIRCIGQFAYTSSSSGSGSMQCNDGTSVLFQFQSLTLLSGYGFGNSARGPISFTYGLTPEESTQYLKLPQRKRLIRKEKNLTLEEI